MINIKTVCKSLNTENIQRAIDAAAKDKMTVFFPSGEYKVTSLKLRDNTAIYLDEGALISAADENEWSGVGRMPVLFSENTKNIRIKGKGSISASGDAFTDANGYKKDIKDRPDNIIRFRNVNGILIKNITLTDTVGWTIHLDNCEDAMIDGILIKNPPYTFRKNSDGIDINGCRNVTVKNCFIETGDDAVCLKNIDKAKPKSTRKDMYGIRVHDCVLASTCNSTKIGTETVGNIYDVLFENIRILKHSAIKDSGAGEPPMNSYHSLSAISVQSNDGAVVKDITFRNYSVETTDTPIFILFQHRKRYVPASDDAIVSNIVIENVRVERSYRNSQILSCDKGKIKDIVIKGLNVNNYENKRSEYEYKLPTGNEYPDVYNFGSFPAYGIFSRNAENIRLYDVDFCDKADTGRVDIDIK